MKQLEAQGFFENRFRQAAQKFKAAWQEELSKKCRVDFLVDTAYFLGFIAIIFAILYLSAKKYILVGDIAAVMVTVRVLMSYLDEIFNEKLAGIVEAYPGLKNLHEVLEMTSGKVEACTPEFQKIELKDVRVYLKTVNTPKQRVFSVCCAPFFLAIHKVFLQKNDFIRRKIPRCWSYFRFSDRP